MAPERTRSERRQSEPSSLASTASDQIRAILDAAEQAAAEIRDQAEADAARVRAEAEQEASGIRGQARSDIRALTESIRGALGRVQADLELLESKLGAAGPDAEAAAPVDESPRQDETTRAAPASEPAAQANDASPADLESARLVALNMALDGAERDEVDRYLSENFAVSDREALLDEVYASVGR